jgi:putative intracellular protease/amidase
MRPHASHLDAEEAKHMSKKILTVLSEWGYWGEELVGPVEVLDAAGYSIDFATNKGKRPEPLSVSMDPNFIDPPLGRSVTTPEMAAKVREWKRSPRLDNPINLSEKLPERPYPSSPNFLREMEAYFRQLDDVREELDATYDALLLVGGSGAIVDLGNNYRVHELIHAFLEMGKPIAAECYAVTCLAFTRDRASRQSVIRGKHVTGHPIDYDFNDGTGFQGVDFNMGPAPYPLDFVLRDAVGPDGQFHPNIGRETSVIVDWPFITARSTPDSYLCGEKLVEVLEKGTRRYGFVA